MWTITSEEWGRMHAILTCDSVAGHAFTPFMVIPLEKDVSEVSSVCISGNYISDSISRDEPDSPLSQYITNAGISRARYTNTHFKHHHRVLRLISN